MRSIGIDIGKSSIKIVEIESSRRSMEVLDYHEAAIPSPEDTLRTLAKLLFQLKRKPDRIALTLQGKQVTFRNLDVPTKDKKAIKALVVNELEDELPFDQELMLHQWTFLNESKRLSQIHIQATLKSYATDLIQKMTEIQVDPDLITSRLWALRTLVNSLLEKESWTTHKDEPLLIVDIGASNSILYVHYQGVPIFFHEMRWGGEDLTRAISKRYNISEKEAEEAKIQNGFVLSQQLMAQASAEQKEFSEAVRESLVELCREIKQASLSCKGITGKKVAQVFVCGGSSLLPGIRQAMGDETLMNVRALNALSALSPAGIQYSEASEAKFAMATAVSLTMALPHRQSIINFRSGELSKTAVQSSWGVDLVQPLTWSGIVMACMLLSMAVEKSVFRGRLEDMDKDVQNALSAFYGGGVTNNKLRVALADPEKLQRDLDRDIAKARAQAKLMDPNPHSPLDFLKGLSQKIESRSVVDMIAFQVGSAPDQPYSIKEKKRASLQFLYSNPQTKEQILEQLKQVLDDVQESKVEEVPDPSDPSGKKYRLQIDGQIKETAYGNG